MRRLSTALAISLTCLACRGGDADLPAAYRRLEPPEARLRSAAARERGRILFAAHCALCHGERADGRGARRAGLSSSPRDFTDRDWARRASARRVYFVIREGVAGTAMPAWRSLSDPEAWDLVAFVLHVTEEGRPASAPPPPASPGGAHSARIPGDGPSDSQGMQAPRSTHPKP